MTSYEKDSFCCMSKTLLAHTNKPVCLLWWVRYRSGFNTSFWQNLICVNATKHDLIPLELFVLFKEWFHSGSMRFLGRTPSLVSREKEELVCFGTWWGRFSLPLSSTGPVYAGELWAVCGKRSSASPLLWPKSRNCFLTLVFDCYCRKRSSGRLLASV